MSTTTKAATRRKTADATVLDTPGYRVVITDAERYWVAESKPMTLLDAIVQVGNWATVGNDSQIFIVPPAID